MAFLDLRSGSCINALLIGTGPIRMHLVSVRACRACENISRHLDLLLPCLTFLLQVNRLSIMSTQARERAA